MGNPVLNEADMEAFSGPRQPLVHQFLANSLFPPVRMDNEPAKFARKVAKLTEIENYRGSADDPSFFIFFFSNEEKGVVIEFSLIDRD